MVYLVANARKSSLIASRDLKRLNVEKSCHPRPQAVASSRKKIAATDQENMP